MSLEGTPANNGGDGRTHLSRFDAVSAVSPASAAAPGREAGISAVTTEPTQGRQCSVWVKGGRRREQKGPGWESHLKPRKRAGRKPEEGRSETRPWLGSSTGNLAPLPSSVLFPSRISLAQPTCSNPTPCSRPERHSSTSDCFCSI